MVASIALSGCGGDDADPQSEANPTQAATTEPAPEPEPTEPARFDESEVADHLGLLRDPEMGVVYEDPSGTDCFIAVVLTDANMVSLYADAGDNVAANPDRTAGVKIVTPEAQFCNDALTQALADF